MRQGDGLKGVGLHAREGGDGGETLYVGGWRHRVWRARRGDDGGGDTRSVAWWLWMRGEVERGQWRIDINGEREERE